MDKKTSDSIVRTLAERYPAAECALFYEGDPFRLLVMAMLSAQCTDARVNIVSQTLFARYTNAPSMAGCALPDLEDCIRSCGLYKTKAKNIRETARILCEKYGGRVPDTMEALLELREEVKDFMDIQIVAFPQYGILSYPKGKELLEDSLKMGADAAGAIPHFEFTREYSVESLNICFELAQKYNKLIDVHCDEIDDEASRGLETVATRAYETGMRDMVTASHTTAMHSYNNAYVIRLMRILKMSGMNFVANPCVNVHLGGRADTYPKRRSMTRVKELTAEGINVSFGYDDIFDPWNPLGNGNMRDPVFMGLYAGHMLGYDEICNSYKFVTTNAARTLHLGDAYGIKEGNAANFVVFDAKNWYDALNYDVSVLYSYRNGKLVAETKPKETTVHY